ncbi:MAG: L-2-amino-thiazoline-4-carboxylic acid hydrolase [Alphaproteobacteria bacterium]|jgi:hypothetical protein|nr:L-2-amino-thiazoline-4-carboxylic acid hydrolase [Alphaproteobacteria bacterium]
MSAFLPDTDILAGFTAELAAALARRDLAQAIDSEAMAAEMATDYAATLAANGDMVVDPPSEAHLARCAAILAGYRALMPRLSESKTAIEVLRDAVLTPRRATVEAWLGERMGVTPEAPEAAFAATSDNFKARGDRVFGETYVYEQAVKDESRNFVNVTRCFFNDFFRRSGTPELTQLCCALDMLWADALNDGAYDVSFERPTTLAQGDDCCRFQFSRKT